MLFLLVATSSKAGVVGIAGDRTMARSPSVNRMWPVLEEVEDGGEKMTGFGRKENEPPVLEEKMTGFYVSNPKTHKAGLTWWLEVR
ncbi:hypothetical protein L1987_18155 [Smallanthus sonchifolius]|uniref:Uncharacterized protein n=1 Tax=Smallanthus sonchifolius TaxID=185202 RepID=A0ACB9J2E3_9ASTR|nr:hypothetical protein L1987_18155 [Smallanthus sonchifolius]